MNEFSRAERLSELDAVIQAEAIARRAVTEHIFEDVSSAALPDGQNTTGNGIDVALRPATRNGEVACAQAVLAERERIVGLLHKLSGHYGRTHYENMDCHWCHYFEAIREPAGGVDDE